MHRIEGENVEVLNDKNLFRTEPPYTVLSPEWLNSNQEEIMNVIASAGLPTLDQSDDTRDQLLAAIRAFAAIPKGTILSFAGSSVPTDYLFCDGSAISRTTYLGLFQAIGTTWGVGDGSTTFNIPDSQGIFLRGAGSHGSLQDANGAAFAGVLGAYSNDRFQEHHHTKDLPNDRKVDALAGALAGGAAIAQTSNVGAGSMVGVASPASGYGTPRTGVETNPANAGVNYIIKY